MKLTIQKTVLLKTIQNVQNIISSRTSLPVLANVLMEASGETLLLTGTDLDIAISSSVKCKIEEPGSITVPAKRFFEIVRELPEETIILSTMKNNTTVIKCGKCFFKIHGLPVEDFPKIPQFAKEPDVVMEQAVLKNTIIMTHFSISHDETRYVLNGALFSFKQDTLTVVTTDGKRLSLVKNNVKENKLDKASFIIPSKTIHELNRVLLEEGEIKILIKENQVKFDTGNIVIISRLIEGEFPNYEQVIPPAQKEKITTKREEMLLGIKRASLLTSQDSLSIKIEVFKNKIIISKTNPNIGEFRDEIDASYKGKEMVVGFNPQYLIDVLKVIPGDGIGIEIQGPDKPAVIRIEDDYLYLVLPMQIV